MPTFVELKAAQEEAGARYAAALAEFVDAHTELAALDAVMANTRVNPHATDPVRTFPPRALEHHDLEHPIFAPHTGPRRIHDEIIERRDALLAKFNT